MEKIITDLNELYAKEEKLTEVKVDAVNWITYYLDEQTGEKWIEERLYPEMHAGGPPQLRLIDKFPWEEKATG